MGSRDRNVTSPVAYFIFNRPEATQKSFEVIRRQRPGILLLIADGPRNPEERNITEECQRIVLQGIDWDCDLRTDLSNVNLGCRRRIQSGLDWVFEQVDRAIIIEDDIIASDSFFSFSDTLLEHYKDNPKVMHIDGCNFANTESTCSSYYFSEIPFIWGWATWRRAWQLYDPDIKSWSHLKNKGFHHNYFKLGNSAYLWEARFDSIVNGHDTWDYQWIFATMQHNALSIHPRVNLISNIGFGKKATHTADVNSRLANMPRRKLTFPLLHPGSIIPCPASDARDYRYVFDLKWDDLPPPSLLDRMTFFCRRLIRYFRR